MKRSWLLTLAAFAVLAGLSLCILRMDPASAAAESAAPGSDVSAPLSTGFTYQGQLIQDGAPVNGVRDLRFTLYDSATGDAKVGLPIERPAVAITGGLFTVPDLDFGGAAFTGQARWLEVAVRESGGGGIVYIVIGERQALTATPYALYAAVAANAETASNATKAASAPWGGLTGVPDGFADGVDNDTIYSAGTGLALTGTVFTADASYLQRRVSGTCAAGSAIRAVNEDGSVACEGTGAFWSLTGNEGTTPPANYLGTRDNQPLELRVNGQRALRLEPFGSTPNLIGGSVGNTVSAGVQAATIAGGGSAGTGCFDGTRPCWNQVTGNYGAIGGGIINLAGFSAVVGGGQANQATGGMSTVAGGWGNTAGGHGATAGGGELNTASGANATVGGGYWNTASAQFTTIAGGGSLAQATGNRATDDYGSVGGGYNNQAGDNAGTPADAGYATVGGGSSNTARAGFATVGGGNANTASSGYATVGGGRANTASGYHATVAGGEGNTASGHRATVGGGLDNTASGWYAIAPGGSGNLAQGDYSFAAGGRSNTAYGNYSFAAGRRAKAQAQGAFVWADSTDADFAVYTQDSFNVRAAGGAKIQVAGATVEVSGPAGLAVQNTGGGKAIQATANNDTSAMWISNGGSGYGLEAFATGSYAGYFHGNIYVTGACVGCATAYVAVNSGPEPLEIGDVVAADGVAAPLAEGGPPVLAVRRAAGRGAAGVVKGRAALVERTREGQTSVRAEAADSPIAAGDHLFIVVSGLVQARADAGAAPIAAGQRLTAGQAAGHAAGVRTVSVDGVRVAEAADVIGVALEELPAGQGLIWILVTLQ